MKLAALVLTCALIGAVSAEAATYRWTDKQGVVHYTDNPASVPPEYKNKVNKTEDITTRNPKVREELKDQEERARQERLRPSTAATPDIVPNPSPPPQVAPPTPAADQLPPGRTKSERVRENRERREGL